MITQELLSLPKDDSARLDFKTTRLLSEAFEKETRASKQEPASLDDIDSYLNKLMHTCLCKEPSQTKVVFKSLYEAVSGKGTFIESVSFRVEDEGFQKLISVLSSERGHLDTLDITPDKNKSINESISEKIQTLLSICDWVDADHVSGSIMHSGD